MNSPAPRLVPPRIVPPAEPLTGLSFLAAFVRNPLEVTPQAVYERDLVAGRLGRSQRLWITNPALLKTVLLDERDKFQKLSQIRLLSPLLGKGILTSEGAEWKWQRQAAAPMFRHQDLLGFVPTFVRATEALVAKWRAAPAGAAQAIDVAMTRATFDVISATLLPSADHATVEESMGLFQRSGGWGQLYALAGAPRWLPHPGMAAGGRAIRMLRTAVAAMLRERRAAEARGASPDDLMHRLMQARDPETGQSMNDSQLVDNLLTFYLAGHETTARALAWTLYLVARSPQWGAALEEEVAGVTGGAPVEGAHIERLVLVQQVLKESMRLYPPVPMLARQCVAATRLDGIDIEPGATVAMPIYAMHRHAKRWEDPDAFDPERFSAAREAKIPRYQYMPFGAGPRICIGMAFAMIEATAMLATLLQKARFAPVPGRDPYPLARVTLQPGGGLPLHVHLRGLC
ncbi:MAG TPA: cytochrome P450 [Burkholderiales bacterium]|nr:cytochrome P450 [Burkholderiales bacterium]